MIDVSKSVPPALDATLWIWKPDYASQNCHRHRRGKTVDRIDEVDEREKRYGNWRKENAKMGEEIRERNNGSERTDEPARSLMINYIDVR